MFDWISADASRTVSANTGGPQSSELAIAQPLDSAHRVAATQTNPFRPEQLSFGIICHVLDEPAWPEGADKVIDGPRAAVVNNLMRFAGDFGHATQSPIRGWRVPNHGLIAQQHDDCAVPTSTGAIVSP